MAGRCTNGHDTPSEPCMYCGAPLLPPPAPPPASAYAPPPRYSARPPGSGGFSFLALASLVLSLLFPLGSIPAVITGHMARARIRRLRQDGDGVALAGLILGWIGTAFVVVILGFAVLVFLSNGIVDKSDTDGPGGGRSTSSCETQRRTLLIASEAFQAQNGYYAQTEDELVYAHMIRKDSDDFELQGNGKNEAPDIVPTTNGGC